MAQHFVIKGTKGCHVLKQVHPDNIVLEGVATYDTAEQAVSDAISRTGESEGGNVFEKPENGR